MGGDSDNEIVGDSDAIGAGKPGGETVPNKKKRQSEINAEEREDKRCRDYDGYNQFTKAQPDRCDEKFEYVERIEMIPDVGFWESYVVKVRRQQCSIGTIIACFENTDQPVEDFVMAGYGIVRETNPFIFEVIPFNLKGSASNWPFVGRLVSTEMLYVLNEYGLNQIPQMVRDQFGVPMRAVVNRVANFPPPLQLPGMSTMLGDTSYKSKLNADKLMGIKTLLRHDKLKSERLFGSLEIIDNQKAKAAISALLLKSQVGMVMVQPQNLPMLVQLIHQRNFVQITDPTKTVAGLHFMHFEVPNSKPLYHRRILDCATNFVAVLRQIVGGDADRYWAGMFAPFLERLSARDEICMEKMQPQLVMETCAEALVRWSLMMTAEENKGISDEELMHKGQAALHIDLDELDRRATREYRERGEKAERRTLAATATAGMAAGRGRGRGGGSGVGGGRGPVLPSAGGWSSAGGVGGGGVAGRNGVKYCIDAVCFHLLGRVGYDGKPVLEQCKKLGKGCMFVHTLPTIPCEQGEKSDLLACAELVRRSPQKYSALVQVMSAPTFSK